MASSDDSRNTGGTLVKLKVPAKHVPAFRLGLLRELAFDGDWVKQQAGEARKAIERAEHPCAEAENPDALDGFLCGPLDEIQRDADVLRQLPVGDGHDVEIRGDAVALKHTLEAVAHHCAKHLDGCEFGSDEARGWVGALAWAALEAERLDAEVVQPRLALATSA